MTENNNNNTGHNYTQTLPSRKKVPPNPDAFPRTASFPRVAFKSRVASARNPDPKDESANATIPAVQSATVPAQSAVPTRIKPKTVERRASASVLVRKTRRAVVLGKTATLGFIGRWQESNRGEGEETFGEKDRFKGKDEEKDTEKKRGEREKVQWGNLDLDRLGVLEIGVVVNHAEHRRIRRANGVQALFEMPVGPGEAEMSEEAGKEEGKEEAGKLKEEEGAIDNRKGARDD